MYDDVERSYHGGALIAAGCVEAWAKFLPSYAACDGTPQRLRQAPQLCVALWLNAHLLRSSRRS